MLRLPDPRGPTSEALLAALARRPPAPARAPVPLPDAPSRSPTTTSSSSLYLCYELHYRGLPGVDERWEWAPDLLALRAELEERFEAALRGEVGPAEPPPAPEAMDLALRAVIAADDAPSLSRHIERDGAARARARVPRAPLGLPAQGGRPALVGHPAPRRRAEGGAGRDPGRRVRRRPARAHARRACSPTPMDALGLDARYGAYLDLHPGRHARDGQPDVAVRPAPAPARRDRRPPRAVRDDLLHPQPPLRGRAAPPRRLRPARDWRSSTSTSRPTRSTRTSPPSTSRAGSPAPSRSWPRTSCGAPGRSWRWRRAGRGTCWTSWEAGRTLAAARRWRRRRLRRDAGRRPASPALCQPGLLVGLGRAAGA